jgi:hypothetical protein
MNKDTELILEAYSNLRKIPQDPVKGELLGLLHPVIIQFVREKNLHPAVLSILMDQVFHVGDNIQWRKNVKITEAEKEPMRMEFECNGKKVKLSTVRKVETDEWVVKVYVDGKYKEDSTYYTDDKEDAIATMKHMAKETCY